MRIIRHTIIILYIIFILLLVGISIWLQISESYFSTEVLIYWMILIGWLLIILFYKLNSYYSLKTAFITFIISSLLVALGWSAIGEPIMKISYIGWVVGIFQAFCEYIRSHES